MSFDAVFEYIGSCGVYQIALFIFLALPGIFSGYQSMAMTFLGPFQDHWCKIDALKNYTDIQQKYIAIPYDAEKHQYAQCEYYDLPYSNLTDQDFALWNWTTSPYRDNISTVSCEEWSFDTTEYSNTAVMKYNLVCGRNYLVSMVYSSYMASSVVAYLLAGPLSDKFGRKTFLSIAVCFQAVLGIGAAFAPNYPSFLFLRFLTTFTIMFSHTCCFLIVMELFGPMHRAVPGGLYWASFSIGFMALSGVAFFIRDFQSLQLVLAVPMFLTVSYIFLVPESPRWLITQRRQVDAMKIFNRIAKINKKINKNEHLPESLISAISITKRREINSKMGITDIVKQPVLRRYLVVLLPNWISCSVVYYGMSFNTGSMAGNVYLNTFLSAFVEIPAYLAIIPCMQKFGRRHSDGWSLIIAGTCCYLSALLIPLNKEKYQMIINGFLFLGKASVTLAFCVIYAYTAELYPTPVRHVAVTFCHSVGNLCGLMAPFTGPPLMKIWPLLPLVLYGTLGIVSGSLIFLLPETKSKQLPDNISDIQIKKSKSKDYAKVQEQATDQL